MYSTWRVSELKEELKKRGGSLKGRKAELIERLELYDKNFNFGNIIVDPESDPIMEVPHFNSYRDIHSNSELPPLTEMHIRQYFCFADKKLKEAKVLYESRYLILARAAMLGDSTFLKGYCKKTMKALQYEVDVKLHKNGTPQESPCECPAGSGTEAKCKHVAVLLHAVKHMIHEKIILLHQVCTQKLQTFHVPKTLFTASPIIAHKLPKKHPHRGLFPYPINKIDKTNYKSKIRNLVLNYPHTTMPLKQLYEPANPYAIANDHAYTSYDAKNIIMEKLHLQSINQDTILYIELNTRGQKSSAMWYEERRHHITASRFHIVCHLKHKYKYTSRALTHGILNEPIALKEYSEKFGLDIQPCGLFLSRERPYLGASPDGLLGSDTVIEVKCPYSCRNNIITAITVPYLVEDKNAQNQLALKKTSPYYYQIQGQLYCTNRLYCNLVVYTHKDM